MTTGTGGTWCRFFYLNIPEEEVINLINSNELRAKK